MIIEMVNEVKFLTSNYFSSFDFHYRFPVQINPDLIQARLKNNYYRSLDSVKHDIMVMLSNAENYYTDVQMLGKIRRLSDFFRRKLERI